MRQVSEKKTALNSFSTHQSGSAATFLANSNNNAMGIGTRIGVAQAAKRVNSSDRHKRYKMISQSNHPVVAHQQM